MQIRPVWVDNTLIIQNDALGMLYATDRWPSSLEPHDILRSLLGRQTLGWYPVHSEDAMVSKTLDAITKLNQKDLACLAMADIAGVVGAVQSWSVVVAASISVRAFEVFLGASVEEARQLVRLNLFAQFL